MLSAVLGLGLIYLAYRWIMRQLPTHRVDARCHWFPPKDGITRAQILIKFRGNWWNPNYWRMKRQFKAIDAKKPERHPLS